MLLPNLARRTHLPRLISNARALHPVRGIGSQGGYQKAVDSTPEPVTSHSGSQTYVVSEPDPQDKPYKVPSGAYASTSPYETQKPAEAPNAGATSSSSNSPPHPKTTASATHNASGVGSSSAVRYRSAPGEMKDGSDGGLGLMDQSGETKNRDQDGLAKRNMGPEGEEEGKMGIGEAWKRRK